MQHIIERKGGYRVFSELIKDALLQKNGFPKVAIEEKVDTERQMITAGNELELSLLLSTAAQQFGDDPNLDVSVGEIKETDEGVEAPLIIKRTERELAIYAVKPENIRHSQEHESSDLKGIRFFAELMYLTRSELIERGLDKTMVKNLQPSQSRSHEQDLARNNEVNNNNLTSPHKSTDVIEVWDTYEMLDMEGNGEAKLWRFLWAPNQRKPILEREQVQRLPYCTGSPFPVPHRVAGLSMFDKIKQIEDAKRRALRQTVDNMAFLNNAGYIAEIGTVHKDSALDTAPGRITWRKRGSAPDAIVPKQAVQFLGESISFMDYLDKRRTEKGGASLDLQGGEAQIAAKNVGDQGVERQLALKEKMTAMVARNMGESMIKELYLLVHFFMREFMPGELQAKLHGKWAQTDPTQWPERKDATINIGVNHSERVAKIAMLQEIANDQEGLASAGHDAILVGREQMYSARMDLLRTANIDNPEQYYIDPESDEAQEAIQQNAKLQAQQAQQQMDLQKSLTDVQNQLEKYKIDMDSIGKLVAEQVKLAIKEAEIVMSAQPIDEAQNELGSNKQANGAVSG